MEQENFSEGESLEDIERTNIMAKRKDFKLEIKVRKMLPEEMPNDGNTYYCDDSTRNIYKEEELEFTN